PLPRARLAPVECEAVLVPEVLDHLDAGQPHLAPWAGEFHPPLARFDQRIERVGLLKLVLKLAEAFESPAGGKPDRQRAGNAEDGAAAIRNRPQDAGGGG